MNPSEFCTRDCAPEPRAHIRTFQIDGSLVGWAISLARETAYAI
jgi:hypothetical protein